MSALRFEGILGLLAHEGQADPEWWHEGSASCPVKKVPEEVLVQVFTLTRDNSSRKPVGCMTDLCCVCRDWRDIIYNTPSLWSVILLGDRSDVALQRSQSAALTVKIPSHTFHDDLNPVGIGYTTTSGDISGLFYSLWPYSDRIRNISVSFLDGFFHQIAPDLEPFLPHLHSLEMVGTDVRQEISSIGEGLPRLRHFTSEGVQIPWGGGLLRGLHTLRLTHMEIWPSRRDMLFALQACPEIREIFLMLTVTKWRRRELQPEPEPVMERILLSSLQSLCIHSAPQLNYLPQFIDAPHITQVSVDVPLRPLRPNPTTADDFTDVLFPDDSFSILVSALRNNHVKQVELYWDSASNVNDERVIWIGDGIWRVDEANLTAGLIAPASLFDDIWGSVITKLRDLGFEVSRSKPFAESDNAFLAASSVV